MKTKPTLVLLAAGMGSRYGGLKQMDQFGPNGESIIDYSIFDAIRSGFGKIVFVVRQHFMEQFADSFATKLKGIHTEFVAQELHMVPEGFEVPFQREKPWGTAHAVLATKDAIQEPFAVINADDFYGRDAFETMAAYLSEEAAPNLYCTVGYQLRNTISDYGTVNRGICQVDDLGNLSDVVECIKISKSTGKYAYEESSKKLALSDDTIVSMNMWGFHQSFFDLAEKYFIDFLQLRGNEAKSEFFIPTAISQMIINGEANVKVLETTAKWFGVTYREDKPFVKDSLQKLIESGEYPSNLWP